MSLSNASVKRRIWLRNEPGLVALGIVLCIVVSGASAQNTWHVPGDFSTIGAAINAASNGDEIIVAPGMYSPFSITSKSVHVRSSAGPASTIVNGMGFSRVVQCMGCPSTTIIEGFTITGGLADRGGGMYIQGGGPTIINCVFANNTSMGGWNLFEDGGGGLHVRFSSPVIINSTFQNNTAFGFGVGGGIMSYSSNVSIEGCTFVGNNGWFGGGMVHLESGSSTISNSDFDANSALIGGAAAFLFSAHATISGCTFTNNFASTEGLVGSLYFSSMTSGDLVNNSFSGNTAPDIQSVYISGHTTTVRAEGMVGDHVVNTDALHLGIDQPAIATVSGDYAQGGRLFASIAGTEPGQYGALNVGNTAFLSGLLSVSLYGGYQPRLHESYEVLTAASISGMFDLSLFPQMPPGLVMRVHYSTPASPGGPDSRSARSARPNAPVISTVRGSATVTITVEELSALLGFGSPASVGLEGAATAVAVGDFDGENGLDIAITLRGSTPDQQGSVLVLFNDGTGESFSGQQYTVGREPSAIAVGDFNGDGLPDIAVTNGGDHNVSILLNDGAEGFNVPTTVNVGNAPSGIVAAQLRDLTPPRIDLAVSNAGSNNVSVLHNDGMGVFELAQTVAVGQSPRGIASGDLSGNGHIDLAVVNYENPPLDPGTVTILMNSESGGGEFAAQPAITVGLGPTSITTIDELDDNKDIDIVVTNRESDSISILRSLGAGTFAPHVELPLGGEPRSLAAWDMDLDGDADLAIVVDLPDEGTVVRILRNDIADSGVFSLSHADDIGAGENPILVTSGDVTGNGADDLITVSAGSELLRSSAELGTRVETTLTVRPNTSATNPGNPADLNRDGVVDDEDLMILFEQWGPCTRIGVCSADLNQDGKVDVLDMLILFANWG